MVLGAQPCSQDEHSRNGRSRGGYRAGPLGHRHAGEFPGTIAVAFGTTLPAAFAAITPFLGPAGLVAAGVVAVVLAWRNWDAIVGLLTGIRSGLGDLNSIFKAAFEGGGGIGGAIQSFSTKVVAQLTNLIPVVGPILSEFAGAFVAAGKTIGSFFAGLFGGPDAKETEGRGVAEQFREALAAMLTEAQRLEVQAKVTAGANERWAQTAVAVKGCVHRGVPFWGGSPPGRRPTVAG